MASIHSTRGIHRRWEVRSRNMSPIGRLLTYIALFASATLAKISVKETDPVESNIVESTVQMLGSCYGNRATPVGLAGTLAGIIGQRLWSQEASPATLIGDTSRIVNNGSFNADTRYKLEVFVVSASSASTLTEILVNIKTSVWWNHMAAFLIIDWPPSSHNCSNAFEMLWTAWKMNILNAKLLCHHRSKGRLIYNFNPYTSKAPDPWRYDGTHNGMNNHPWTLFVREYVDDERVCDELDFEKTKDLGGYEIRISAANDSRLSRTLSRKTEFDSICLEPQAIDTCTMVFHGLNATLKVKRHFGIGSLGYVDGKGKAGGILAEVARGEVDIGMNSRYMRILANLTSSYPFSQNSLYVLTRYNGYKSQLSKIASVIDGKSRLGLYLVVIVTIVFFKYFLCQSSIMAHMNTLRICCSMPILRLSRDAKDSQRLYLASLFMFELTMQGIFQGSLASLLTNPQPLPNVDTLKDLAVLGHTIYGYAGYRGFFETPAFEGRYVKTKGEGCTEHVLNDPRAACVGGKRAIFNEGAKFNLHVSREPMALSYVVLPIRPDWPLEEKFNKLLTSSADGDLRLPLSNLAMSHTYRTLQMQRYKYEDKGPKVVKFKQLRFAFVFLGTGLGIATAVFVVEKMVWRWRP